jgi:hypothetical protein
MSAIYAKIKLNGRRIKGREIYNIDDGLTFMFLDETIQDILATNNKLDYILWKPGEIEEPEAYFKGPNVSPVAFRIKAPNGLIFHFTWHEL